jgi:hypothetical protein
MTFDEWCATQNEVCTHDALAMAAWHARDSEILELNRYRRAIDNHLCKYDKADWLGCNMSHGGDYCDVCESDPEDHTHKRAAKFEKKLERVKACAELIKKENKREAIQWACDEILAALEDEC